MTRPRSSTREGVGPRQRILLLQRIQKHRRVVLQLCDMLSPRVRTPRGKSVRTQSKREGQATKRLLLGADIFQAPTNIGTEVRRLAAMATAVAATTMSRSSERTDTAFLRWKIQMVLRTWRDHGSHNWMTTRNLHHLLLVSPDQKGMSPLPSRNMHCRFCWTNLAPRLPLEDRHKIPIQKYLRNDLSSSDPPLRARC